VENKPASGTVDWLRYVYVVLVRKFDIYTEMWKHILLNVLYSYISILVIVKCG